MWVLSDILQLTLSSTEALKLCVAITRCLTAQKSEKQPNHEVFKIIVQVEVSFGKSGNTLIL
jgi:hypothetical protein